MFSLTSNSWYDFSDDWRHGCINDLSRRLMYLRDNLVEDRLRLVRNDLFSGVLSWLLLTDNRFLRMLHDFLLTLALGGCLSNDWILWMLDDFLSRCLLEWS